MRFAITVHAGFGAPPDALALLWERIDKRHEDTSFRIGATEITAIWGEDAPVSMESDERSEIGRRAVLDVVTEACERSPGLKFDWFAVAPRGR